MAQCAEAGVACFVKQMGDHFSSCGQRVKLSRHGADPAEWAETLRVREFPR